jgi:zinc transport system substrate-binding protein
VTAASGATLIAVPPPSSLRSVALAVVLLGVVGLLAACAAPGPAVLSPAPAALSPAPAASTTSAASGEREVLPVAVSVPPQAYLVERIGGSRVRVEVMIPPGASEATYSPNPRQMVSLSHARLYVEVGHPAFLFEPQSIAPFLAVHPEIRVVDMSRGMDLITTGEAEGREAPHGFFGGGRKGGEEEHPGEAHDQGDPHVWVAPATVAVAARNIERALEDLDPAHAAFYRGNLARLSADIADLDREIRTLLARSPGRSFMVYHPAWGYFARQYGLRQIAVEAGGREPSARQLIALIEEARRQGVRAIFVQRGFARKSAEVIAGELGGRVIEVDPMERDWLSGLRRAARAFQGELAHG